MAWRKKHEMVDTKHGMDVITLHDPVTGGEHKLQIVVGHDSCPHCGHVVPKTNLGYIDRPLHIKNELEALERSHANQREYAKKHNVQVREAKQ